MRRCLMPMERRSIFKQDVAIYEKGAFTVFFQTEN